MAEQWVVTYRVETFDGTWQMEFYRGERAECERIGQQSGSGSDDLRQTKAWVPVVGPASEWDAMLREAGCG